MDKFVAIWLFNEFNDKDNLVIFMFREFEKGQKIKLHKFFFVN